MSTNGVFLLEQSVEFHNFEVYTEKQSCFCEILNVNLENKSVIMTY